ncbi:MAG: RT0821/Lpp0805 family surface protein [Alphaproteobacteria bacterium]
MKKLVLIPMMAAALSLGACETMQNSGNKQAIGGASGAVIGGILGSKIGDGNGQLWATGAGALIGAFLGSEIGASLDRADLQYAAQASERAHSAPVGETISWNNPESGNHGTVTPVNDGYSTANRYCREYEQEIFVGGRRETGVGQACQNADGTWEIVNS